MTSIYHGKRAISILFCVLGFLLAVLVCSINGFAEEITVHSAVELQTAMKHAQPGDTIIIGEGNFVGAKGVKSSGNASASFYSNQSGTAEQPITLKGCVDSVLEGLGKSVGYVFYLTGDYWNIENVTIKNGKKGIMLDNVSQIVLSDITITSIGEEGIHVRDGSSFVSINNCTVTDTGTYTKAYGEGIYVGSDYTKWDSFEKNVHDISITNCTIGPNVRAESIDVKEGAINTLIQGNTFFGSGISGANSADSFIDVKGNDTFVLNNTMYQQSNSKIKEYFQVHQKHPDFGYGTVIKHNNGHGSTNAIILGLYNNLTAEIEGNQIVKETPN